MTFVAVNTSKSAEKDPEMILSISAVADFISLQEPNCVLPTINLISEYKINRVPTNSQQQFAFISAFGPLLKLPNPIVNLHLATSNIEESDVLPLETNCTISLINGS